VCSEPSSQWHVRPVPRSKIAGVERNFGDLPRKLLATESKLLARSNKTRMDAPVVITLLGEFQGLSAFVPPERRRHSALSGTRYQKIFIGGDVPETKVSSRTMGSESARREIEDGREEEGRAELRLRMLHSLPRSHRDYLYGVVRGSCERYLRAKAVPQAELSIEELLSEVWAKLLGAVVVKSSSEQMATA